MIEGDDAAASGRAPIVRVGPSRAAETERSGLNAHARGRIGSHLRAMYDTVVQQPVPDRFRELIEQLGRNDDRTRG